MLTIHEFEKLLQYFIWHHSYSQDLDHTFDIPGIFDYHINEHKWRDVGYNELIETYNGRALVVAGRTILGDGAHTLGMNHNSYGACVVGCYDNEKPSKILYDKMLERSLIAMLTYKIPIENFIGHWESFVILGKARTRTEAWKKFKTCPGRTIDMDKFRNDLYAEWVRYNKQLRS